MYIHPYILAIPLTILTLTTTNTTITMTWTSPSFTPQDINSFLQCRRLCEETVGPTTIPSNSSISSPYTFTGIDPGTYCIVGLNGVYGNNTIVLVAENTTTLSSGKLCYIIIFTIIMLLSYYLQHPLHLSVISLYHQLRQGP